MIIGTDELKRFWCKVKVGGPNECWEWQASKTGGDKARGAFHFRDHQIHAHRFSWMIENGEIPPGMQINHICDNGSCVNPKHLYLGTQSDNLRDAFRRKRRDTHGEKHPHNKLTEKDVIKIRQLYRNHEYSQFRLADMFGVARSTIEQIVLNKNWRHIECPS